MTGEELLDFTTGRNTQYTRADSDDIAIHEINRAVTELYDLVWKKDYSLVKKSADISVISGTAEYDLSSIASDFLSTGFNGGGVFVYNDEGKKTASRRYTSKGSDKFGYYIENEKLYLTPEPSTTRTETLEYIPEPEVLEDLSDDVFLTITGKLNLKSYYNEYYVWALSISSAEREGEDQSQIDLYVERRDEQVLRIFKEISPRSRGVISI